MSTGSGRRGRLVEAALAATDIAAAALALEGPPPVVHRRELVEGRGAVARPGRPIAARPERGAAHARRARRPVLGFVDPQGPALEVLAVHQADGLLGRLVVLELDEGEAAGTPR